MADKTRFRLELERQVRDIDELIRDWEAFRTIVERETSRLLAAIRLDRDKFESPKERREYVDRFLTKVQNVCSPVIPNSLAIRFASEIESRPEISGLVVRSPDDDLTEWRQRKDYAAPVLESFKKECENFDGDLDEALSLVVRATTSNIDLLEQRQRSLEEGKRRLLHMGYDHIHEAIDSLIPFVESLANDASTSTSVLLDLAHSIREGIVEELTAICDQVPPVEAGPSEPELSATYLYRKNPNRPGWWEIQYETARPLDFPDDDGFYLIYLLLSSPRKCLHVNDLRTELSTYKQKPQIRSAEDIKDSEHSNLPSDGGNRLDDEDAAATRSAIEQGLVELTEKRAEAEKDGDQLALAQCDEQLDFFKEELKKLKALLKRSSKTSGTAGRARTAVSNSIDRAIKSISQSNSSLASHLRASISKGYRITYSPPGEITWILS